MRKIRTSHICDRCNKEFENKFTYKEIANSLRLELRVVVFSKWFKSLFVEPFFEGFDGREFRGYDVCKDCTKKYLKKALEALERVEE